MGPGPFRGGSRQNGSNANQDRPFNGGRGGLSRGGRNTSGSASSGHLTGTGDRDRLVAKHYRERLIFCLSHLVGEEVLVETKNNSVFQGVLHGCSVESPELGVVLKCARERPPPTSTSLDDIQVHSTMIVPGNELVQIIAMNISVEEDNKNNGVSGEKNSRGGFQIDKDIGAKVRSQSGRELRKFDDFAPNMGSDRSIDLDNVDLNKQAEAWNQFAVNKDKFGVETSYDEHEYTTKLDTTLPDYKSREEKAERIAAEISGMKSKNIHIMSERNQLAGGDHDEEEMYSSVVNNSDAAEKNDGDEATAKARFVDPSIVKAVPATSSRNQRISSPAQKQRSTKSSGQGEATNSGPGERAAPSSDGNERQKGGSHIHSTQPSATPNKVSAGGKSYPARAQQSPTGYSKGNRQGKNNDQEGGRPRMPSPQSGRGGDSRPRSSPHAKHSVTLKQGGASETARSGRNPKSSEQRQHPEASTADATKDTAQSAGKTEDVGAGVSDTHKKEVDRSTTAKQKATSRTPAEKQDVAKAEASKAEASKAEAPQVAPASTDKQEKSNERAEADKAKQTEGKSKDKADETPATSEEKPRKKKFNVKAAEFKPAAAPQPQNVVPNMYMQGQDARVMRNPAMFPPNAVMQPNYMQWAGGGRGMMNPYVQQPVVNLMPVPAMNFGGFVGNQQFLPQHMMYAHQGAPMQNYMQIPGGPPGAGPQAPPHSMDPSRRGGKNNQPRMGHSQQHSHHAPQQQQQKQPAQQEKPPPLQDENRSGQAEDQKPSAPESTQVPARAPSAEAVPSAGDGTSAQAQAGQPQPTRQGADESGEGSESTTQSTSKEEKASS